MATPLRLIVFVAPTGGLAVAQSVRDVPHWVWWTSGGILGAAVMAAFAWYFVQGFHRRVVWAILACIGFAGSIPKVLAWFEVPGFGAGGLLVESAPLAAWPLATVAIAAMYFDDRRYKPSSATPPTPQQASDSAKGSTRFGGRSAEATSGLALSGDYATQVGGDAYYAPVTHHHGDPHLADRLIEQAQENGKLKLQNEQLAAEKQQLEALLTAALARVETQADAGDPAAEAAIKEARDGGDPSKLQDILVAERDRQGDQVRRQAREWIKLNREIAAVAYVRGEIEVAAEALQNVLALEKDDPDAINSLGHIYRLRGDLAGAEQQYHRLLKLRPDDESRAVALANLGRLAYIRGNLSAAGKLYRESLEINRKLGRAEAQSTILFNLAGIAQTRGEVKTAKQLYGDALKLVPHERGTEKRSLLVSNLGVLALGEGDLDAAEKFLHEALDINRKLGHLEGQAGVLGNLGCLARYRHDPDAAEKLYRDALEIERKLGRLEGQANQLTNLGVIALTKCDADAAEKLYLAAMEINEKLGRFEGQAVLFANLGIIAKRRGDVARARRLWRKSRDLYAKVGIAHRVKQVRGWLRDLPTQ